MKRWLHLAALVLAALVLLAACGAPQSTSGSASPQDAAVSGVEQLPAGAEIALITTASRLESAFGQGVWNAISRFAGESGYSSASYKAEENDADAALSTLELAVKSGARLVVSMDASVTGALETALMRYSEVEFILLDAPAGMTLQNNAAAVAFSPEQAGWLAGYVAGGERFPLLAFACTEEERSLRYALGFTLGAEAALEASGGQPGENGPDGGEWVRIKGLVLDAGAAEEWPEQLESFCGGASEPVLAPNVLFCADEAVRELARPLAEQAGFFLVEEDGAKPRGQVLASLQYDAKNLVAGLLAQWKEGSFPGGTTVEGGLADGAIAMEVQNYSAKSSIAEACEEAVAFFTKNNVAEQMEKTIAPGEGGALPLPQELELTHLVWEAVPGPGDAQMDTSLPLPEDASSSV